MIAVSTVSILSVMITYAVYLMMIRRILR